MANKLAEVLKLLVAGEERTEEQKRKQKIADALETYKGKLEIKGAYEAEDAGEKLLGRGRKPPKMTKQDLENIRSFIGQQVTKEYPMNTMGRLEAKLTPWATELETKRRQRGEELYRPYQEYFQGQFLPAAKAPAAPSRIVGQFGEPSGEQDTELRQQAIQALQEVNAPATEKNIREAMRQLKEGVF